MPASGSRDYLLMCVVFQRAVAPCKHVRGNLQTPFFSQDYASRGNGVRVGDCLWSIRSICLRLKQSSTTSQVCEFIKFIKSVVQCLSIFKVIVILLKLSSV